MTSPVDAKSQSSPPPISLADLYGRRPARERLKTGVSASNGWAALLDKQTSAHRDEG